MTNMKRVIGFAFVMAFACMTLLSGCDDGLREEAQTAAGEYNAKAAAYNEAIKPYNDSVEAVREANKAVTGATAGAQSVINKGEEPFDSSTLTSLKEVMAAAEAALIELPEKLDEVEELTVDEGMERQDIESIIERAANASDELSPAKVPSCIEVPDYSESIEAINVALKAYEDSIQGLKQVTAPSDDFVIERIQGIETVGAMAPVTEDHDPNGKLNKQGGYIGCVYFRDNRIDFDQLYFEGDSSDVVEIGTDGGGAVEVFKTVEDAEARNDYLASFDGSGFFSSGSHAVVGTVVVRTSDELTASQQEELTTAITNALIRVG